MITEIEDFFQRGCGRCARFDTADCSARHWAAGLGALRTLCRDAGLEETVKWGHPCYMRGGRNVAIIGAFRGDFRLTFFDAGLLDDPDGLLQRQGAQTAHPDAIRFTDGGQVAAQAQAIRALLAQAITVADMGARLPPRAAPTMADWPAELAEALAQDGALDAAFRGLTPGRQRSYLAALASAKSSETRRRRIAASRDRILQGKGATER